MATDHDMDACQSALSTRLAKEMPALTPGPCALCETECGPEEFCYGCVARLCLRCADVDEQVSLTPVGEHLVTDHAGPVRSEVEDRARRLMCDAMWRAEVAGADGARHAARYWRGQVSAHRDMMHALAASPRRPD